MQTEQHKSWWDLIFNCALNPSPSLCLLKFCALPLDSWCPTRISTITFEISRRSNNETGPQLCDWSSLGENVRASITSSSFSDSLSECRQGWMFGAALMADGQMDGSIHIHPRDASRLPCQAMSVRKQHVSVSQWKGVRVKKTLQNSRWRG